MKVLFGLMIGLAAGIAGAQPVPVPPPAPVPPMVGPSERMKKQEISRTVMVTCKVDDKGKRECSEQVSDKPPQIGAMAVLDQFSQALKQGKTDEAAALLDESVSIFEGGVSQSKSEYLAEHIHSDAKFLASLQPAGERQRQARVINGMAVITTMDKSRYGESVLITEETAVLMERDGVWRIVHLHWSSAKQK